MGHAEHLDTVRTTLRQRLKNERQLVFQAFQEDGMPEKLLRNLRQVVDAVRVPVIAAGGISDGRGIAAAFALGAAGVQIGSAYLRCPESKLIAPARKALTEASDEATIITNVMTGRPARGPRSR